MGHGEKSMTSAKGNYRSGLDINNIIIIIVVSSSISSLLSGWNYSFMSWKIKSFLIYDVRPFFNSGGIQQIFNSRD